LSAIKAINVALSRIPSATYPSAPTCSSAAIG